ncbi:TIR domain-containing protein [Sphingopyxis sp. DHUNG17]|uniref:TIR domain-containing protein n=1 Tax=Sphingopyxis jiangsuensis TaxID=2871171 RepID=UPI00191D9640|nr:TIR domain-containing protein [Sphingopyxis lutea]MBL0768740.1 TIR domain-containing protein [Sphingopyxis lutea]
MAYNVSVFVSHSWSYSEHYERLSGWIFNEPWYADGTPINFFNTSVPREDPIHYAPNDTALQTAIFERLKVSNVIVVPTGMYSTHSKWIGKELKGARLHGKKIVAVNPWGQERKSSVVQSVAHETVGWNKNSVINAVWRSRS